MSKVTKFTFSYLNLKCQQLKENRMKKKLQKLIKEIYEKNCKQNYNNDSDDSKCSYC